MDLARRSRQNEVFGGSVPIEVYSTAIHEMAHAFQALLESENQGRDIVQAELLARTWRNELYRGTSGSEWRERISAELDQRIERARQSSARANQADPFADIYDSKLKKVLSMGTNVARENHILSSYSLASEEEYFAESAAAYVMKQVFEKRYAHVTPASKREELRAQMERLLEARDGLRASNLSPEAEQFLERHLHGRRDLRFDRQTLRPDGLRGIWVRHSPLSH
jgi:hypothetical protein